MFVFRIDTFSLIFEYDLGFDSFQTSVSFCCFVVIVVAQNQRLSRVMGSLTCGFLRRKKMVLTF